MALQGQMKVTDLLHLVTAYICIWNCNNGGFMTVVDCTVTGRWTDRQTDKQAKNKNN
jgi:hypothetical protein